MYGTSVKAVEAVAKEGSKTCILDIDTQVRPRPSVYLHLLRSAPVFASLELPDPTTRELTYPDPPPQGVKLIKAHHASLNPIYVFISPPSLASLKERLTGRGTESEASMGARLGAAIGELEYAKTGAFDLVVVNDDLDRAYGVLRKVIVDGATEADKLPSFEE